MKHLRAVRLALFCALAVLQGCERKAPDDVAKPSNAGPPAESKASPKLDPAGAHATEMIAIAGGTFMMGD